MYHPDYLSIDLAPASFLFLWYTQLLSIPSIIPIARCVHTLALISSLFFLILYLFQNQQSNIFKPIVNGLPSEGRNLFMGYTIRHGANASAAAVTVCIRYGDYEISV